MTNNNRCVRGLTGEHTMYMIYIAFSLHNVRLLARSGVVRTAPGVKTRQVRQGQGSDRLYSVSEQKLVQPCSVSEQKLVQPRSI